MKTITRILLMGLGLTLAACSSNTTGSTSNSGSTPSSPSSSDSSAASTTDGNIGAAVTSVFGSQKTASLRRSIPRQLLALLIREAAAQTAMPRTACDALGQIGANDGISVSSSVTPGSYGAGNDAVTLTELDGCAQGGPFASFTVGSKSMTCTDGSHSSTVTMTNSTGVWRESADGTATQVRGTFQIDASAGIKCSFTITHGTAQKFSATCEDGSGNAIAQSADVSCS